ncbi:MAG: sigma-70 family RNA polymerase sigma factor [Planctomycetales bacterium]
MSELTQILHQFGTGNRENHSRLLELVYDELRAIARAKMASEVSGQTLQPTALVHEAWLRLTDDGQPRQWQNREHFLAAAAEAMRRILVDAARRKGCTKRGGERTRIELVEELVADRPERSPVADLIALDQALSRFAQADPQSARLVELRYFGGMSNAEAAQVLNISVRSATRLWGFARAWLFRELTLVPNAPCTL